MASDFVVVCQDLYERTLNLITRISRWLVRRRSLHSRQDLQQRGQKLPLSLLVHAQVHVQRQHHWTLELLSQSPRDVLTSEFALGSDVEHGWMRILCGRRHTQGVGWTTCMAASILSRPEQATTTKQYRWKALTSMCSLPALIAISNIFFAQLRRGRVGASSIYVGKVDYNNMLPRTLMRGGLVAALLMVLVLAEEGAVVILNATTFQEALEQNQQVVLYFSQEDCKHCSEFSEIFALVGKLHSELAVFYKLTLSPQTGHLFSTYAVDSTPTVLAFSEGEPLPFRYEPAGSGNGLSVQLFKWVERLFKPLQQWEGDDSHSHQLIVQCRTEQFADFWQEVSRNELWLDVYCGSEPLLKGSLAIVHEYGRQVEAWQLENAFDQVSGKLRRLIRAYKYKYVLAWSTALAQEVFRSNVSAFVLIVNNDSRSRELQGHYEEIKKQWYENSHNYEPTIFAVADLSLRPYETMQLKRFLTGHATFSLREYYYPIVGFIARGAREGKYLLNLTADKNRTILEEFIATVDQHIIRGQPYSDEEMQVTQWLREGAQEAKKDLDFEDENEQSEEKVTKILTQKDWNDMLLDYSKPFLVYFTWRNSFKLCQLEQEFTDWWEGEDPVFAPHRHAYDVFLHMYHVVDLPVFPGLTLDYFPSLYYFSANKDIVKLEGVTNLEKIKQFITEALGRDAHH